MNTSIKNLFGLVIMVMLLILSYAAISYVRSYSIYARGSNPNAYRSFSVTGEGKVIAIPDIAQFTFTINTEGKKDIIALQNENTGKVNKAIEFLKGNDVEAKDIQTQNYSVEPRYQYTNCVEIGRPCPPPTIAGYAVVQTVLIKVRDLEKTGSLLSGVVKNGATSVSELSFTIDDRTELENKARAEAIEKARLKAEATAKEAQVRLGKLLWIEEGGAVPLYDYGNGRMMTKTMDEAAAPAPGIEPGSQEIRATVTLRYEID